MRPVLAAAAADDPRRAAELADPDDERLIEQAATVQVVEQRREPLVGRGHQAVLELIEVVAVRVPEVLAVVVPVDRHQADARLDQPTRQQEALTVDVPPIAVAEPRAFPIDREGPARLGRDEAVERFLLIAVPRLRSVAGQVGRFGELF